MLLDEMDDTKTDAGSTDEEGTEKEGTETEEGTGEGTEM